MLQNVLKYNDIKKICLNYVDGKKNEIKTEVFIKLLEDKACYFMGKTIANFSKPRWRAKVEIVVYTAEGLYSGIATIKETTFSLNNITYKTDLPKKWEFKQLRTSYRQIVKLPVNIVFEDGQNIESNTYDISSRGFSVISEESLSTMQTKFPCVCKIKFPKDYIENSEEEIFEQEALYTRQQTIKDNYELINKKKLCFKFVNLNPTNQILLKNLLSRIR